MKTQSRISGPPLPCRTLILALESSCNHSSLFMSDSTQKNGTVWDYIQALFFVSLAAVVAYYGNGELDLVTLILHGSSSQVQRRLINLALLSTGCNIALFLYFSIWLEMVRGVRDPLNSVKWAAPAGAATLALSLICYIFGLWPALGIFSIPIVIVELYGIVIAMHFAPTLWVFRNRNGSGSWRPPPIKNEALSKERLRRAAAGPTPYGAKIE